jgi:hypothetical protein
MSVPRARDNTFAMVLALSLFGAVLVRMPQLTSPFLAIDGDEAVLGVMSLLLLDEGRFPVFFLGRRHGLSTLEALAAAGTIPVLGPTPLAIKLAMLALWLAGAAFLVLAVRAFAGRNAALCAAPLLACIPTWGAWSMKARGGYLTAFVLSSAALWLIAELRSKPERGWLAYASAGALFILTCAAQPFFGLALGPFLLLLRLRPSRIAAGAGGAIGALGVLVLIALQTPPQMPENSTRQPLATLLLLPKRLWVSISGAYYYFLRATPGPFTYIATFAWGGLAGLAGLRAIALSLRERRAPFLAAAIAAALLLMGMTLFVRTREDTYPYRYFLPLAAIMVLLVASALGDWLDQGMRRRRTALIALIALCLTSTLALTEFRRIPLAGQQHILDVPDEFPEPVAIGELIDTLQARSIHHAWVVDAGLRWILLYRSGLSLTTVLAVSPERYVPFTERVVEARAQGLPTAVVGYAHQWRRVLQADSITGAGDAARGTFIRDQLFFLTEPSTALLEQLLFAPARTARVANGGNARGRSDGTQSSIRQ